MEIRITRPSSAYKMSLHQEAESCLSFLVNMFMIIVVYHTIVNVAKVMNAHVLKHRVADPVVDHFPVVPEFSRAVSRGISYRYFLV